MIRRMLLWTAGAAFLLPAQEQAKPPAEVPGDAIVATLNGRKFTADELRKYITAAGQQVQAYFARDPKQFLRDHAYYLALLEYAEKQGLEKQSPTKEQLEFSRLVVLTSAALNDAQQKSPVSAEEQKQYYTANSDQFRELTVRMIYVPFAADQAEEAVEKKAVALAKRARAGEDFEALGKEVAGQSGTPAPELKIQPSSTQPPQAMKDVLFQMKEGEVTEPLRHENGYYIFRIVSAGVLPYESVRDEIYKTIQQARFQQWQAQMRAKTTVQFNNEAFFQQSQQK
ncbi:MAG TPA: peptidyl-prolyl cis-trans isomerase [Bryobacteraceae bacterium]|nr:peptidyl-prolyl cis-trans isomerase [Bryobacteraceae bacterium]